jgi:hypothetical protein
VAGWGYSIGEWAEQNGGREIVWKLMAAGWWGKGKAEVVKGVKMKGIRRQEVS